MRVRFCFACALMLPALAGLLAAGNAGAANSCSEDWVCVEVLDRDGGYDLVGRNLRNIPVTVTVDTRLINLGASREMPVTRALAPHESVILASLEPLSPGGSTRYRYWFDWAAGDGGAQHDNSYRYRLPYASGERFGVLQGYGSRFSHTGNERFTVDFDMPTGTPVFAAREGVVARVQTRHNRGCWEDHCGRYANFIVIAHSDGTTGEYYHLQKNGALVKVGDHVSRGQHIGFSGNTGHTTMPHLHFGVYRPLTWDDSQSIEVIFATRDGQIAKPRPGRGYFAK